MKDDLVEKIARAMCEDDDALWDAKDFGSTANGQEPEEQREYWRGKARVAIPAILEEAAQKSESLVVKGLTDGRQIASAIRSLATTGQEGGR